MGQTASEALPESMGTLIQHARTITDVASLSYDDFLDCIRQLNTLCCRCVDSKGRKLVFAVKKGSDTSILWKSTVRIACVRVNVTTNKIESHKILNLPQLLKVAHTLKGHLVAVESSASGHHAHDILSTSVLLNDMEDSCMGNNIGECCICLERKPEVILPCAHSYCLPCIEQWNVNHKTCPICREKLESTDDSWVISEAPDSDEVNLELEKSLINLSGGSGQT
ncbi:RING finger protein 141-like [Neocloeon triangulifer]|uniref:RING finger protein 141-like n=1 Tax=Neocloeon triangulifer TaxID=2078957 RepID=UPI00286F769C|nr:RING finger protein 141-like [Neocloeon triangulifer]